MPKKGEKISEKHRQKISASMSGKKHSKKTRLKMSLAKKGEKHWNWQGDIVGQKAMHSWVRSRKGSASDYKCEHCDKQAKHWSNKNHQYNRILEDYQALCAKCHEQYDRKYNNKYNKSMQKEDINPTL